MRTPRYQNSALVRFIKKWTVPWGVMTTVLYAAAIPITIWVFPATTLLLTVFVLFGSFTASMNALGASLVSAEQDKAVASLENEVSNETVVPHDQS